MYRKAVGLLVLGSFVYMFCFLCVKGVDAAQLYSEPADSLKLELWQIETRAGELEEETLAVTEESIRDLGIAQAEDCFGEEYSCEDGLEPNREECGIGIADVAVSGQRVIDFLLLEQRYVYELTDEELEVLLRIVEAEAGNEDEDGKLLVANVVLNRVASEQFPDTVTEVVFQKEHGVTQFSPVSNGSYYRVKVSDETASAVGRALMGEDLSEGALYFAARKYVSDSKMKWFDENLTFLFQHGGHEFFK